MARRRRKHFPLLSGATVSDPCEQRWDDMAGSQRERHCDHCNRSIHNLSAMSAAEAEALLSRSGRQGLCVTYERREDGLIETTDLTKQTVAKKRRWSASSTLVAGGSLWLAAAACESATPDPPAENRLNEVGERYTPESAYFGDSYEEAPGRPLPPTPSGQAMEPNEEAAAPVEERAANQEESDTPATAEEETEHEPRRRPRRRLPVGLVILPGAD